VIIVCLPSFSVTHTYITFFHSLTHTHTHTADKSEQDKIMIRLHKKYGVEGPDAGADAAAGMCICDAMFQFHAHNFSIIY